MGISPFGPVTWRSSCGRVRTAISNQVVCAATYGLMQNGDWFPFKPPRGFGANLTIRYRLPRPA